MPESALNKKLLLKRLKHEVVSDVENALQKEENMRLLANLIAGALFLEEEPQRKEMWLEILPELSLEEMNLLAGAIMRENLRWKKRERNLRFERVSEIS